MSENVDVTRLSDEELLRLIAAARSGPAPTPAPSPATAPTAASGKGAAGMVQSPSQTAQNGSISAPDPLYDPTVGMGGLEKFLAGVGSGAVNFGRRAAAFALPKSLTPQWASDDAILEQERRDAALMDTTAGKLGRIGSELAIAAPLGAAGAAARGMAAASKLHKTNQSLFKLASIAGEGALAGHLLSGDALTGALSNTALAGLGGAAKKAVTGINRTKEADALLKHGVPLTPGQLNPGGAWSQLETFAENLPIFGPTIKRARELPEEITKRRYASLIANKEVAGETWPEIIEDVGDAVSRPYRAVDEVGILPRSRAHARAVKTLTNLHEAANAPDILASAESRLAVGKYLSNLQTKYADTAVPQPSDLMAMRSSIRAQRRVYANSTDSAAQEKAALLDRAEDELSKTLYRVLPGQVAQQLRNADRNYAQYRALVKAVAMANDRAGGPTFAQLATAQRQALGNTAYAKGRGGETQDLIRNARVVFTPPAPPTGARAVTQAMLTGLGGAAGFATGGPVGTFVGMGVPAGILAVSAASPLARELLTGTSSIQRYARPLVESEALASALRAGRLQASGGDYWLY